LAIGGRARERVPSHVTIVFQADTRGVSAALHDLVYNVCTFLYGRRASAVWESFGVFICARTGFCECMRGAGSETRSTDGEIIWPMKLTESVLVY